MRAKYQIMSQTNGGEARVLFTSTRKYDTERYFNSLRKSHKKIKSNAVCDVRIGYFTVSSFTGLSIIDTEYWICKA